MLALARGGAIAHFFMPHRGVFGWTARPYRVAFAAFPNKINDKCPGEGGVGTLGIAWTIIDQAEGQDGWILAKFVCPFLWTESRPIDSHLDRISWNVNDFKILLYDQKDNIFLGNNARNPEPAWLANQNAGFVSSCPLTDSAIQ